VTKISHETTKPYRISLNILITPTGNRAYLALYYRLKFWSKQTVEEPNCGSQSYEQSLEEPQKLVSTWDYNKPKITLFFPKKRCFLGNQFFTLLIRILVQLPQCWIGRWTKSEAVEKCNASIFLKQWQVKLHERNSHWDRKHCAHFVSRNRQARLWTQCYSGLPELTSAVTQIYDRWWIPWRHCASAKWRHQTKTTDKADKRNFSYSDKPPPKSHGNC
jgi:hypothetical protein